MDIRNKFKDRRHDDFRCHKGWKKRFNKFIKQVFGYE